jgi:two-component system response regulator YesN
MYKVFLVEDEIVVREGIRDNVRWESTEFIFCGEAPDGELALPLIEKTNPDILITDIKMPFMDGLELSRYIKRVMPKTKIIMISGHQDFSYAKQAISIGIEEYVLKPINSKELLETLKKVARTIDLEKDQSENMVATDRFRKENVELQKEKVLNEIVRDTIPPHLAANQLRTFGLDIYAKYYGVISIRFQLDNNWNFYINNLIHEAVEKLIHGRPNVVKTNLSFREIVLIVKGDEKPRIEEDCRILQILLLDQIKKIWAGGVSIGIGEVQSRLQGIARAYHDIAQPESEDIAIHQYEEILGEEIRNMSSKQGPYLKFKDKELLDALRCDSEADVLAIVREYFDAIEDVFISPVWSMYLAIRINLLYSTFLAEIGEDEENLMPPQAIIEETALDLDTREKLKNYMEEICLSALAQRTNAKRRNHSELVEMAKSYVEANYMDPQISLRNVASQIYISDCHLSTIYKRETGISFIQHLTSIRIRKAKELLQTTNMKAGDVGLKVGYKDPHYFSYIFKKNTGCSPSQYKELHT